MRTTLYSVEYICTSDGCMYSKIKIPADSIKKALKKATSYLNQHKRPYEIVSIHRDCDVDMYLDITKISTTYYWKRS